MAGQLDGLDTRVGRPRRDDQAGVDERRFALRGEPVVAPVKAGERRGPAQLGDPGSGDRRHLPLLADEAA
jgi:hypothetical protein